MNAIHLRREQRNALPRDYQKVRYLGLITGALQRAEKKSLGRTVGTGDSGRRSPRPCRGVFGQPAGSLAQARGSITRALAFRTERMRLTAFTTAGSSFSHTHRSNVSWH